MSTHHQGSAKDLIKKIATDKAFRSELDKAKTPQDKSKVLAAHGFGHIKRTDVPGAAFPAASEVEGLSDAQLKSARSAANDTITTTTTTTTVFAGAAAAAAALA